MLLVYKILTGQIREVEDTREPEMHLEERSSDSYTQSICKNNRTRVKRVTVVKHRRSNRTSSSSNTVTNHNENSLCSKQLNGTTLWRIQLILWARLLTSSTEHTLSFSYILRLRWCCFDIVLDINSWKPYFCYNHHLESLSFRNRPLCKWLPHVWWPTS